VRHRAAAPPAVDNRDNERVVSRAELANPERHGATASTDTDGWQSRWLIIASIGGPTATETRPARWAHRWRVCYREIGTSCQSPPLRLRLLPLAWPGGG